MKSKQKKINAVKKDTQKVKETLQGILSILDFSYIWSLFLVDNDKSILHHDNMKNMKIPKSFNPNLLTIIQNGFPTSFFRCNFNKRRN